MRVCAASHPHVLSLGSVFLFFFLFFLHVRLIRDESATWIRIKKEPPYLIHQLSLPTSVRSVVFVKYSHPKIYDCMARPSVCYTYQAFRSTNPVSVTAETRMVHQARRQVPHQGACRALCSRKCCTQRDFERSMGWSMFDPTNGDHNIMNSQSSYFRNIASWRFRSTYIIALLTSLIRYTKNGGVGVPARVLSFATRFVM